MKNLTYLLSTLCVCVSLLLASCEKVEDPFVGGVESPVLVVIEGTPRGDYSTDPTAAFASTAAVPIGAFFYELDKTNILNAQGIDSIPVASLSVSVSIRGGAKVADIATDGNGKATVSKTWAELGLATPKAGNLILMQWSGSHKGQAFVRYFKLQVK
ncbi:MAG: hypothetical protein H7Y04_00820 [Verrucomicrobia bacterium]|nr:hypothetical protein [Cytophagales bacterium]